MQKRPTKIESPKEEREEFTNLFLGKRRANAGRGYISRGWVLQRFHILYYRRSHRAIGAERSDIWYKTFPA